MRDSVTNRSRKDSSSEKLGGEHLQSHRRTQAGILGAVDNAHASPAQKRNDAVAGELGSDPRNH